MHPEHLADSAHRAKNGQSMSPAERAIFRDEALIHYMLNEEKVELPVSVSPTYFAYFWIISLLLMVVGLMVTFWPLIQNWVGG